MQIRRIAWLSLLYASISLLTSYTHAHEAGRTTNAVRVYQRLLGALSGQIGQSPVLQVIPASKGNVKNWLYYNPKPPARIVVREEVLQLCETFGSQSEDALACLLGHELAHFFHQHGQKQGFFAPLMDGTNNPYASQNLEAIADRTGIFLAYLAGYNAFNVAPAVYRRLYERFKLPDSLHGYPPKRVRIQMVADTAARVRELARAFDVGEAFYMKHDYQAADEVFTWLLSRYPSAIIFNNLGAIKLNKALRLMDIPSGNRLVRYAYPVEFDADNRLATAPRRDNLDYKIPLKEALNLLEAAHREQPYSESALVNVAIAYWLLDESAKARQTLRPLLDSSRPVPNAVLLLAIIEAGSQQVELARQHFRQAKQLGAYKANENLQLFEESQKATWEQAWKKILARLRVNIAATYSKSLPTLPAQLKTEPAYRQFRVSDSLVIKYAHTANRLTFQIERFLAGKRYAYQIIKSNQESLPGLPLGMQLQRIASRTSPITPLKSSNGSFYSSYKGQNQDLFLVFCNNRLTAWTYITND